jgi:hypothetical protein
MGRLVAATSAALCLVAASAAVAMTSSDAKRIARAASVTAADVPGYKGSPSSRTRGEDLWGGKTYARCTGRRGLGKGLADVTAAFSRSDSDELDIVGSEIEVMPNASYAKQDVALVSSAKGRRCLLKELKVSPASGLKVVHASITKLSPPVPNGAGLHIVFTVVSGGDRLTFYTDFLVIRNRNVEAAVIGSGSAGSHPRVDLDRLLNIVDTRLDAALNPEKTIL